MSKVTNTLYPKFHWNHTVNIQSGLGLSRVVGEKILQHILKGKPKDIMWWQGLYLHEKVWAPWTPLWTGNVKYLHNISWQSILYDFRYRKKLNFLWIYISRPIIWTIGCCHCMHYVPLLLCNTFVTEVELIFWCLLRR